MDKIQRSYVPDDAGIRELIPQQQREGRFGTEIGWKERGEAEDRAEKKMLRQNKKRAVCCSGAYWPLYRTSYERGLEILQQFDQIQIHLTGYFHKTDTTSYSFQPVLCHCAF